jgi:alpha-L-rhamnosidase
VGTNVPAGSRYFRKSFDLAALPTGGATLNIAGDDGFVVWLNGQRLGSSTTPHFAQRVYAFDATPHLRKGKNVLAVQVNNLADKLDNKLTTPAGLLATLVDRSAAEGKPLAATDRTWRATAVAPEGWNQPTFDDVSWVAAKPWPANPSGWPWQTVVWDSVVQPQLPLGTVVPITAAGNIRDYASNEGFPSLESCRANVPELATDTAADPTFLRIGKGSPLQTAGVDKKAVGTP